jgi:Flp pilus assembly protein TadB
MSTLMLIVTSLSAAVAVGMLVPAGIACLARHRRREGTRAHRCAVVQDGGPRYGAGRLEVLLAKLRQPFGRNLTQLDHERALPQMIDVLTLGLQAGLSFDQAFMLYAQRFDTGLARCCRVQGLAWTGGLITRDDALRQLGEEVDIDVFYRLTDLVVFALRFGVSLAPLLDLLASEARRSYLARMEEKVLKAGTKMLIPTGMLILPALLILVMGPAVLQIADEFF